MEKKRREKNAFKKDKEELQKRSNKASQPSSSTQTTQDQNHRNLSSYHPNNMKDMINLTISSQKTSSATIINLAKKDFIPKNHELIIVHIIKIATTTT